MTLIAIIVGLVVTVGVMAASDDGRNDSMSGHMDDDAYKGMMGAMAGMDSNDMLDHMQDVLGDEGYQQMLGHFADHRDGGLMAGDPAVDQMMHSMMDGMMQHMPSDSGNVLPPSNDEHHKTPSP